MKKTLLTLTIASFSILFKNAAAQNLVPNPGFETQTSCPAVSEIQKAPPWNSPSLGTPDLFNSTCSQQNSHGRTGIGCSGIFCYSVFPDSREYIQAQLTSPLAAGQTYCVSFYVKRSGFLYSVSTIGAYFPNDSMHLTQTDPLPYTPQVESPSNVQLASSSSWTEISGTYTASGGEGFIIIGNFHNDATTNKQVQQSSLDSVSYYYIDDISVTACPANGINDLAVAVAKVYPNPATDQLSIELSPLSGEIKTIAIYDLLANKLSVPFEIEAGNTKARFNTSQLAPGNYVVMLTTSEGRLAKRICITQ